MHGTPLPHKPARVQLGDYLDAKAQTVKTAPPAAAVHNSQSRPSSAEAIAFLKQIDPTGRHNLTAINPATGKCTGRTFPAGAWLEMAAWIDYRNGAENLYFSVNEPKPSAPNAKLSKDDIGAIRCICADLDPGAGVPLDEARKNIAELTDRICAGAFPPTVAVDSGGGEQFFWVLAEKIDAQANQTAAEAQGRAIADLIGGDAVQSTEHIMRLPGTMNLPDANKLAKGRVKRVARITHSPGRRWTLDKLAEQVEPVRHSAANGAADGDEAQRIAAAADAIDMGEIEACDGFDDLPADLRTRFTTALENSQPLRTLWHGEKDRDQSVSGFIAALASRLAVLGFGPQDFGHLAWVWPISDRNKGRAETVTLRALSRAWGKMGAPVIFDVERFVAKWYVEIEPDNGNTDMFGPPPAADDRRYEFLDFDEAADQALTDHAAPLIKGLLDQGAMTVLYGDSNVGKTFVAMDIAYHIGASLDYAGMKTAGGMVVYVAAEGGRGARRRVAALKARYRPKAVRFKLLPSTIDLRRPDADVKPLIGALMEIGEPIVMIVIDTFSRAMAGGDENSSVDMGLVIRHFDMLREATAAHVLIVHHTGKERARGARGHSSLRAATDTEIEVSEGLVEVTKQRDQDKSWTSGFTLERHVLGVDRDGDPITSCTVRLCPTGERARAVDGPIAVKIARISDQVMADLNECALSGTDGMWGVIGELMRSDGLTTAKARNTVTTLITSALLNSGQQFERDGQIVRIRAYKNGGSVTAPWMLRREFPKVEQEGQ